MQQREGVERFTARLSLWPGHSKPYPAAHSHAHAQALPPHTPVAGETLSLCGIQVCAKPAGAANTTSTPAT